MSIKRKTRTFNVEFLPIIELREVDSQLVSIPMDISSKLHSLSKIDTKKRFKYINGENIRLQEVRKIDSKVELNTYSNINKCNDLWVLKFIKFKDNEVYGIADEDGNYDEDILENLINNTSTKGHLASPTVCLYDGNKNIMVMARNREGVGIGEILEFLSKILKNEYLDFGYVSKKANFNMDDVTKYRNVDLAFENLNEMKEKEKEIMKNSTPSVYLAIQSANKLGIESLSLKGSMGKSNKTQGLSTNVGKETLFLSRAEIKSISRIRIGVIVNGKKTIDTIDFLQDKLTDIFTLSFESGRRIKSNLIEENILNSYEKNYNNI